MQKYGSKFFKGVWKISRGYWQSEEKWYAGILLAVIIGLQLLDVYAMVKYNAWQNTFYNTIQNLDKTGFLQYLGYWPIFTVVFLVIEIYKLYLQQLLEIKWRSWLTDHYLTGWLKKRTYYLMQIVDNSTDNPDQRISEDLRLFVYSTLTLALGFLRAVIQFCTFIVILWNLSGSLEIPVGEQQVSIPGYMVWVAIIYALTGSFLTAIVGKSLVGLDYAKQRYEADFRFSMIRLRENSEGVAFYHGEQREQTNFNQCFTKIIDNFRGIMARQKKLSWVVILHWRLTFLFPYLVCAPRLFSGQMQLGGLMQTASAFTQVEAALTFVIRNYFSLTEASLAELQAVVNRLINFIDHMNRTQEMVEKKSIEISHTSDAVLSVNGLNVALPNGELLLKNLELKIHAGDKLLITGASGIGKSTLMKTLAGIWPFGQGNIHIPENQKLLFLPQKPYLPLGTLRDVILYPSAADSAPDEKIREIMTICKLGHLTEKLDQAENWSQILSLGEQQRVAFTRAILQRPEWLFLDEATSALDEPTEKVMYHLVQEQLPKSTVISVGHRSTLTEYHKLKLSIEKAGAWKLAA
ncbi:Vitamin B12 transport ATP-binding protein BacA [Sporomusa silvacetica DSM 10669]|uniref:Vitamin B12 transport ATP-binding protein BacA n=1 Tax=Sporomusa silvacetica DSM 10669 TaxID=1123289 RepID=A0ABZ3IHD4_9FIRM|nr:ABC transporter ATP-binding protein/permease [Sporomusa silvacetica]OZC14861.1 vitamin B12 transport ATP-binding protein BacA [Sporomusa silvacetica DSM 10669]